MIYIYIYIRIYIYIIFNEICIYDIWICNIYISIKHNFQTSGIYTCQFSGPDCCLVNCPPAIAEAVLYQSYSLYLGDKMGQQQETSNQSLPRDGGIWPARMADLAFHPSDAGVGQGPLLRVTWQVENLQPLTSIREVIALPKGIEY